jgi:hypothetical protein
MKEFMQVSQSCFVTLSKTQLFSSLTKLVLQIKRKQKKDFSEEEINSAVSSLKKSKNLRHLDLGRYACCSRGILDVALACEKLHTVMPTRGFTYSEIKTVIEERKELKELDVMVSVGHKKPLFFLSECKMLEKLSFTPHFDSIKVLTSLKYLTDLEINCPDEESFQPELAPNSLPQILSLYVSNEEKNCLVILANACPNLRSLDLLFQSGTAENIERAVREFVIKCPKLEVMQICISNGINISVDMDQVFDDVWRYLPNLKIFSHCNNFKLSKIHLRKMFSSSKNLFAILSNGRIHVRALTTVQELVRVNEWFGLSYSHETGNFNEIEIV